MSNSELGEPDFTHGYLRIPWTVWLPFYCRGPLTRRQLQLVSVVIRESWGWQTGSGQVHLWTRPLPVRQFAVATGLSTDHLRRDLETLVALEVLRRRGERYQFVGTAALGITRGAPTPERRSLPPEPPERTAEAALGPLASKKRERKQRNVLVAPGPDLSPGVENSSSSRSPQRSSFASEAPAGISAGAIDRLLVIVAAFVGPLSPAQVAPLRQWIGEVGVAGAWQRLEPAFRLGLLAGRRQLAALLSDRNRPC